MLTLAHLGAQISAVQLSMYIYSLSLFGFLIYLAPQIRNRSPLPALSFAYLYLLDSAINIGYTLFFAASWFFVLSSSSRPSASSSASSSAPVPPAPVPAATINEHSPAANVSRVALPGSVAAEVPHAVAIGSAAAAAGGASGMGGVGVGVLQPESATSILLISVFWAVRLYFIVVVFAWARQVVRASAAATPHEEPFERRTNGGAGWRGRLGRALLRVGPGYWRGGGGWAMLGGNKRRTSESLSDSSRFRRDRISVEV